MASTVRTRIFILSDTHEGRQSSRFADGSAFRQPFPKADLVLHSGDLTMTGQMHEYEQSLELLESLDAELKLVMAGNHDLSLDEKYYLTNEHAKKWAKMYSANGTWDAGDTKKAMAFWTSDRAKNAGVRYLTEGLHEFSLSNGATFTIYASPWQPEFCDWAFNYPHFEDRWNPPHLVIGKHVTPAPAARDPHPIPENTPVDIVMTHGPAYKHLDRCNNGTEAGCPQLLNALRRVRPRLHCCGHIHEAWGAERVAWDPHGDRDDTTLLASSGPNRPDGVFSPLEPAALETGAVHLDLGQASPKPLQHGQESLLVNSCIVDHAYKPYNAGFLVDIDLPRKTTSSAM